jgi:hypothetical protein
MESASAKKFPCPGLIIEWSAGSQWDTYPYQVHANCSLGWEPIAFSKATNTITICADTCCGTSPESDTPCQHCGDLPSTTKFQNFVTCAVDISEYAHWEYLNLRQLMAAMR